VVVKQGHCLDTSGVKYIKVFPLSQGGTAQSNGTHCTGTTTTIRLVGNVGSIQWQSSVDGINFNDMPGRTKDTLKVSPKVDTYYKAIVTSGSCQPTESNSVKLSTIEGSQADSLQVLSSNPVCAGKQFTVRLVGEKGTVQWQKSTTGGTGNWSDIANETTPIYTYQSSNPDFDKYFRAVVKIGACPSVNSDSILVKFIPGAVSGSITADKDTFCISGNAKLSLAGYTGGIRWQKSTTTTNWSDIAGATGATLQTGPLTQTTYFRAITSNGTCEDTTKNKQIQVYGSPVGGAVLADTPEICLGKSAKLHAKNYYGLIQWQESLDSTNFTDIPRESDSTIVHTPKSTLYYRIRAYFPSCAGAYSTYARVKVLPAAFAGNLLSSMTIQPGVTVTLEVKNSVGSIQWQYSKDGETFTDIPNTKGTTYSVSPEEDSYYRVKVTSLDCVDYGNVIKITVDFSIVSIYPVPSTTGSITVKFHLAEQQELKAKIYDMIGRLVREQTINAKEGQNEIHFDINDLQAGVHNLLIETKATNILGRFIKE
jgi:hypothetical protein